MNLGGFRFGFARRSVGKTKRLLKIDQEYLIAAARHFRAELRRNFILCIILRPTLQPLQNGLGKIDELGYSFATRQLPCA